MKTKLLILLCSLSLTGCNLFHRPDPPTQLPTVTTTSQSLTPMVKDLNSTASQMKQTAKSQSESIKIQNEEIDRLIQSIRDFDPAQVDVIIPKLTDQLSQIKARNLFLEQSATTLEAQILKTEELLREAERQSIMRDQELSEWKALTVAQSKRISELLLEVDRAKFDLTETNVALEKYKSKYRLLASAFGLLGLGVVGIVLAKALMRRLQPF